MGEFAPQSGVLPVPDHPLAISMDEVLGGNNECIQLMKQEFKAQGWCYVELPKRLVEGKDIKLASLPQVFSDFFAQPHEAKAQISVPPKVGYSHTDHKEGLHFHTGIHMSSTRVPDPYSTPIRALSNTLDSVVVDLLDEIADSVFGLNKSTLAQKVNLALAYDNHVGMLDIAHYYNKKSMEESPPIGYSTEEVNCVPHYDPGLLTLSFLSTYEGLQLFNPHTQQWHAGPVNTAPGQENMGVIWLGAAAAQVTKDELKAGVHRVVYSSTTQSRITSWYEVCTLDQINQDLSPPQLKDTVVLPNLPGSKPLVIEQEQDSMNAIENYYGIPTSKSMRESYPKSRFRCSIL